MDSWVQTLDTLKSEVSPHTFNTWFKPLQCKTFEQDKFFIEVPNTYYKDKIQKEYSEILLSRLRKITMNENVQMSFVLSDEKNSAVQNISLPVENKEREIKRDSFLNPKYTFDSFVVGNANQFAHAACQAVANAPGKTYNPLFLYGGVGLGKTHLLSAIGNEVYQSKQRLKVVYRSSEQFMNELINSIRLSKMEEFRSLYRYCDVLLLDDIHFFTGKERTQEEFFHTFNALYQNGKQIVLSSDRMPNEIPDLDERLRSRFQAGLFCDIQKPDVETRVAILRKKADQVGLLIRDDMLFLLADSIDSNIRILEGCLTKLSAISSLSNHLYRRYFKSCVFVFSFENRGLKVIQKTQGCCSAAPNRDVSFQKTHHPLFSGVGSKIWWKRPHHHHAWTFQDPKRIGNQCSASIDHHGDRKISSKLIASFNFLIVC